MPTRDVVVVAASAGGIEALRDVLSGLAPDFAGVVLIVLHMPSGGASTLPAILGRVSPIPVAEAVDDEQLEGGRVYVCRADHHLLLGDGRVRVRRGPMEHGHRPAADPLFRSAARRYGPRAVGVVLSGTLSDGTDGLRAIRSQGGVAVVQDPADALYPGMPHSAIEAVGADHVVPAAEIGPLVTRLAEEAVGPNPPPVPDDVLRFRGRVGRAWSSESLADEPDAEVEEALWMALRSLEDRATLSLTLADRAEAAGRVMSARQFRGDADDVGRSIGVLRHLLHGAVEPRVARGAEHG